MANKSILEQLVAEIQRGQRVQRHGDLTLTTNPQFYAEFGNIFDLCAPGDITTLYYERTEPLLDWMGSRPAEAITIKRDFIAYSAPRGYTTGDYVRGLPTSLCTPGAGYEWVHCDFTLDGFGHVLRSAPTRKVGGNAIQLCQRQPAYRIDGQRISNQDDWDMWHLLNAVMRDIAAGVLVGNRTTDAVWDANGLNQLVKTGYTNADATTCYLMDSTIIDWNGLAVCGNDLPEGEDPVPSVNGVDFAFVDPKFYNLFYILRAIYHRNVERLRLAGLPRPRYGDVAIVAPYGLHQCIVDCAVCWIECAGDFTRMTSEAAAARRADFMSGRGGFMEIDIDGFRIPLIPYNPLGTGDATDPVTGEMNNADGTSNMFMLFRGAGNRRVLYLEYNDLSDGATEVMDSDSYMSQGNGEFLFAKSHELFCEQMHLRTEWRLYSDAPWLQTKIENVACESLFGDIFPLDTFQAADPANLYTR